MSTILNTLTREEILRIMEIITTIAGPTNNRGGMVESCSCEGILPPSSGTTAFGIFINLKRIYRALDPNNIDIHIRKDELDFTRILNRD